MKTSSIFLGLTLCISPLVTRAEVFMLSCDMNATTRGHEPVHMDFAVDSSKNKVNGYPAIIEGVKNFV